MIEMNDFVTEFGQMISGESINLYPSDINDLQNTINDGAGEPFNWWGSNTVNIWLSDCCCKLNNVTRITRVVLIYT